MSFQDVLARLLTENDHAVGAIFLDDTGETIDLASTESSTYELKVVGAHLSIHLQRLGRILSENELGLTRVLHFQVEGLHTFTMPLPDGYHLALLQRAPALVGRSVRSLRRAVASLHEELFAS